MTEFTLDLVSLFAIAFTDRLIFVLESRMLMEMNRTQQSEGSGLRRASLRRRANARNVSTSSLPYGGITYLINSFHYPNLSFQFPTDTAAVSLETIPTVIVVVVVALVTVVFTEEGEEDVSPSSSFCRHRGLLLFGKESDNFLLGAIFEKTSKKTLYLYASSDLYDASDEMRNALLLYSSPKNWFDRSLFGGGWRFSSG